MIKNLDSYYELMHDNYIPENEPYRALKDCVKFAYSESVIDRDVAYYLLLQLRDAFIDGLDVEDL